MSDAALVLRARGGDELALRRLLEAHRDVILGIESSFFHPWGDAADVHQEAMIAFERAVQGWRPARGSSFRSFMAMVVRRRLGTMVKQATARKHRALTDADSFDREVRGSEDRVRLSDLVPDDPNLQPPALVERMADICELVDGIAGASLSELEQAAILGVVDGVSYTDLAERLGVDTKAVDNAAQRARLKLRARLSAA